MSRTKEALIEEILEEDMSAEMLDEFSGGKEEGEDDEQQRTR